MQTAIRRCRARARWQLLASSWPSTEAALAALLNELNGLSKACCWSWNDYHLIEAGRGARRDDFLLEHQPPQLRLVLATGPMPRRWRMRARVHC